MKKLKAIPIVLPKEAPKKMREGLQSYLKIMGGIKRVLKAWKTVAAEAPSEEKDKIINDFVETYAEFYGLNAGMTTNDRKIYFKEFLGCKDSLKDPKEFAEQLMTAGATKFYFSFATKAVHTFNPDVPIYDSHVLAYLKAEEKLCSGLRLTRISGKDETKKQRERERVLGNWEIIQKWYSWFEKSGRCKEWINWFDGTFKKELKTFGISKTKKIDFILYVLGVE